MPLQLEEVDPQHAWSPFVSGRDRPWNRRLAAHLYRRAGFGASHEELDKAAQSTPAEAVASLLNAGESNSFRAEIDNLAAATLATGNVDQLAAWWLHRMRHTTSPLIEKLTLFWHGHFATSAEKVDDAKMMFAQNQLLRQHALGDFGRMVHEVSRDPAMLIYLDSATNRKAHPNENFAREIMELFCLGEGNYSERDIQELARCFTGWEVKRGKFRFNRYQHDSGEKTVFGRTGRLTGEDGVNIVLEQPSLERFIARKLVRFFVFDEPELPDALVDPLAHEFRNSGLQIRVLVERILASNLFFSKLAVGRKVRSPVELAVGLLKAVSGTTNLVQLSGALKEIGQGLFFPPNVKGWDGGRTWINTSTLLGRANLVRAVLTNEKTRFAGGTLESFVTRTGIRSPDALLAWFEEQLCATPLPQHVRSDLVRQFKSTGQDGTRKLVALIHTLSTLPEFQLS